VVRVSGGLRQIRAYCETDVINTLLVYMRFQCMRGVLTEDDLVAEEALVRATLQAADGEHWREFVAAWPDR
jgi:predicted PolB exonuclease-like 3'-5' exonuclease